MDSWKVGSEKENSRMYQNDKNALSWVKGTKTLKTPPTNGKDQKHPLANQKLTRKLSHEFRSLTKSLVRYSVMEGLPCGFKA